MGGPHQSPQTTIHTPGITQFSLAATIVGNMGECRPEIIETFFCLNLPHLRSGDVDQSSVTMGAPIRALKQPYIALE